MNRIPAELNEIINKNRAAALPMPHQDIENIINIFLPPNTDTKEDERLAGILRQRRKQLCSPLRDVTDTEQYHVAMQKIFEQEDLNIFVSREQLCEDIFLLFDLLRHAYSGYRFFGGDDVFLPKKNAMLENLSGMADPLRVSSFLNDLIVPALHGAIADNHFVIHDIKFTAPAHTPYMNKEFILRKESNSFVTKIDRNTYKILEVRLAGSGKNTEPVEGTLPTLTPEGEFAWVFGLVTANGKTNTQEIMVFFENTETGETSSRRVNLTKINSPKLSKRPMVSTHEADGIPVLEIGRLLPLAEGLDDFTQPIQILKNKPVFVLDLRGLGGGYATFPGLWVQEYAGKTPEEKLLFAKAHRKSKTANQLRNFLIPIGISEMIGGMADTVRTINNIAADNGNEPSQIPIFNNNLIIVLTDNNTDSEGDLFVGCLRQLKNVLFAGTNTKGAFLTGGFGRTSLPHSGLGIMFGTELNLRPDLSQFEGAGFMPDLWIPPEESLERVLRFIERAGLQNSRI